MICVHFQGKLFSITVIQIYALTSNAEAEVERLYEDLQDLLEVTPRKDVLFIIEDWNAKAGSQEIPGITGKFGLGVQNEAGQRLTEFAKRMYWSYQTPSSNITRDDSTPDGQYQNQTEYILCSQRWRSSTQSAKTRLGADCSSDQEFLITKFRIKLK